MKLYVTEPDFLGKFFLLAKLGKWPKTEYFRFNEKLGN